MKFASLALLALVAGAALAMPAAAQVADDWDLVRDEARGLLTASVEYGSGHGLMMQCQDGELLAGIRGLPAVTAPYRQISIEGPDLHAIDAMWSVVAGEQLAIGYSPRMARLLYRGGQVAVRYQDDAEQDYRLILEIPIQSLALTEVLQSCGVALTDDRDGLHSVTAYLERPFDFVVPEFTYQRERDAWRFIDMSCIVRRSRLQDCRADRIWPHNPGNGDAAVRAVRGRRVHLSDEDAAEGGVFDFQITSGLVLETD